MAASIPSLLFGSWTAHSAAADQRASALRVARKTVDRVADRVTAEMTAHLRVAETLAAFAALDGPEGAQLRNLLRPLGPTADRDTLEQVVRTREPVVGGIGPVGPVSGLQLVALREPVMRGGARAGAPTPASRPGAVGDMG